jgi:hypothetical protein
MDVVLLDDPHDRRSGRGVKPAAFAICNVGEAVLAA